MAIEANCEFWTTMLLSSAPAAFAVLVSPSLPFLRVSSSSSPFEIREITHGWQEQQHQHHRPSENPKRDDDDGVEWGRSSLVAIINIRSFGMEMLV